MNVFYISLALLISLACPGSSRVKFSEVGKACSKSDPKFEDCILKTASEQVLPELVEGIRLLDLYPIDPMHVSFVEINQSDRPVGLKLNITDSTHTGFRNLKFEQFRYTEKGINKHFEFTASMDKYTINGTCETGGRILILPISGLGPCMLSATGIGVIGTVDTKEVEKKGEKFCEAYNSNMKLSFKGGAFELHGLFNGNKQLEATMNRFLNENALDVINEVKHALEVVWAEIMFNIVKHVFNKIPCDELILP